IIMAFISAVTRSYSSSTVSNYTCATPSMACLAWALSNNETEALLKVALSIAPPHSKRPSCKPYTMELLTSIWNQLGLTFPMHTAVFTCLTMAFCTTAHTGKLTTRMLHSFN
ncbi:hypothetical protein BS17DRAFT_645443, partial [Gyrodon lividus]